MEITKEKFIEIIKESGVVGAGGAGFPTYFKLNTKADFFIVNIAECEPLLKVDQQIAEKFANQIVQTVSIIHNFLEAKNSFIAIKKKYERAVNALSNYIKKFPFIKLKLLESVYPAGDEQDLVYNCTGRIVPETGIPIDVGVVVDNVGTILNIYNALRGEAVTERWLTISGAVRNPVTTKLPIGTLVKDAIEIAGGSYLSDFVIFDGGPMMGKIVSENDTIKKTTSGIIVLPKEHFFVKRKLLSIKEILTQSRSACEQCFFCTEYCPRYLLGHSDLKPHLMMRKLNYLNIYDLKSYTDAYLCSGCGICSYFACPMLLSPKDIYNFLKTNLIQNKIKNPYNKVQIKNTNPLYKFRKAPLEKLINRLGLSDFDKEAPLKEIEHKINYVKIELQQHIGAPAEPVVYINQKVEKGKLIAKVPDNKLGANIHSSISGKVVSITEKYIEIRA